MAVVVFLVAKLEPLTKYTDAEGGRYIVMKISNVVLVYYTASIEY